MSDMYDMTDDFADAGDPGLEEAHFYWVVKEFGDLFDANRTGNVIGAMDAKVVEKLRSYFANKR